MRQKHQSSFLTSSLLFLLHGITAGIFISVMLIGIVMLFTDTALAGPVDDMSGKEMLQIDHPDEVTQGSLLFRNREDFSMAPVLKTDVQITVTGMIARTILKQEFRNPLQEWQEGIYVFPLPENAAVDYMRMHIGDRIIEGQIREKDQARKNTGRQKSVAGRPALLNRNVPTFLLLPLPISLRVNLL